MAYSDDLKALTGAGRALTELLEKHLGFVRRAVAKYEAESKGGQVIYAASVLSREIEGLETALAEPVNFEAFTSEPPEACDWVALSCFTAIIAEIRPPYDPDGHHQAEIRKDWVSLSRNVRKKLKETVPEIYRAIGEFEALANQVLKTRLAQTEAPRTKAVQSAATAATPGNGSVTGGLVSGENSAGGGYDNTNNEGDGSMANNDNTEGIIDAISRLQGTGGLGAGAGTGTGTAANAINAFSNQLDQTLNMTLGIPALTSDAAKALSSNDLVGKLFEGLGRSVADEEIGGVRTYEVNPLRARGASHEGQGMALGAQAVSAATIRGLKNPIMTNVYKLVAETTYGEQDEAEDLRIAIDEGIDKLIAEAKSDTGIYQNWAQEIIRQVCIDLFRLASQYGLLDTDAPPANIYEVCDKFMFCDEADDGLTKQECLDKVFYKPAIDRILRDPDIGILTAEANDRAFSAIVDNLCTIGRLIVVKGELGPLVGRIRALNDTLPASVSAARNALAIAGVSEADQYVTFSKRDPRDEDIPDGEDINKGGGISLHRLLSWIEAESLTSRTQFLREDLNQRDIQRLCAPRLSQREAVKEIIERNFPMVNRNDYAIGRRHLIEIREHLDHLVGLMNVLVARAEARSA